MLVKLYKTTEYKKQQEILVNIIRGPESRCM